MKIKNGMEEEYQNYVNTNSQDAYSHRVVTYAEDWANFMEESGRPVVEVAEETSILADHDGITGFMYGCAVSSLAKFWEHGEELRKWHNKQYNVDEDKPGTVNPAVFTISNK